MANDRVTLIAANPTKNPRKRSRRRNPSVRKLPVVPGKFLLPGVQESAGLVVGAIGGLFVRQQVDKFMPAAVPVQVNILTSWLINAFVANAAANNRQSKGMATGYIAGASVVAVTNLLGSFGLTFGGLVPSVSAGAQQLSRPRAVGALPARNISGVAGARRAIGAAVVEQRNGEPQFFSVT